MNVNKSNDKRKLVTRWSRNCIHVWIYENGAKELKSRPKRASQKSMI